MFQLFVHPIEPLWKIVQASCNIVISIMASIEREVSQVFCHGKWVIVSHRQGLMSSD